jgi:DNA-directed RNA polymerase I, II, and III subunit RPABC1
MHPTVQKTTIEMLTQRGYDTTLDDESGMIVAYRPHFPSDKIIVFYNCGSITISHVKDYISILDKTGFQHAIVIYKDNVTPQSAKTIALIPDKTIETFQEKTLLYNITKHRLVPKHRCLTLYELTTFKRKYGSKIPYLLSDDPIARFYGFHSGDIIEITRHDGIVAYRIVK